MILLYIFLWIIPSFFIAALIARFYYWTKMKISLWRLSRIFRNMAKNKDPETKLKLKEIEQGIRNLKL